MRYKELINLLGIPYDFLAMPQNYQRVMFEPLASANCLKLVQRAYWEIFQIFIPPEMILLPYSYNDLGEDVTASGKYNFGDILFLKRKKQSEKISKIYPEELLKHLVFYVGNLAENDETVYVLHASYKKGKSYLETLENLQIKYDLERVRRVFYKPSSQSK